MIMFALAISLATPTPADFTLEWNESSTPVHPMLQERFTVHGDEITYVRFPGDPSAVPMSASIKRPDAVRALIAKLPKGKKGAASDELRATYRGTSKTDARAYSGPMPTKADDPAMAWMTLRDELRKSLGLIPDAVAAPPSSVGVATLKENGDLWLQLYSAEPGQPVAEALKIIKAGDPELARYLKHVGGLKPGESKKIPPFD